MVIATISMSFLSIGPAYAYTYELLSLTNAGQPPIGTPAGSSYQASVTPDGRYIAYEGSFVGLVADSSISNSQIYLRDRVLGTTELISQSTAGVAANGSSSGRPTISNDGCRVVFESMASNLVSSDSNGASNVFVRNRCTNGAPTTTMVDILANGSPGSAAGDSPRISGDGRIVVFRSSSNGVVTGLLDHNGFACTDAIYLRNLDTGATSALMRPDGGCLSGREPDVSFDGNRIAFWKYEPVITADANSMWDIYIYDVRVGPSSYSLVSASTSGAQQVQNDGVHSGEGVSSITAPAISQDGRIVAFRSCGYGLVPNLPINGNAIVCQVYVKNTFTGDLAVASASSANVFGDRDSGAGTRPAMSSDGQYVTFNSTATNLVASGSSRFVRRNVLYGGTTGFPSMVFGSDKPDLSSSGRYLTIYSGDAMDSNYASRGWFLIDLGIPYAPTITRLTPGAAKITVQFTPSSATGAIAATSYQASCESANGSPGSTTGSGSPLTVTGLKNGVDYNCTVTALNSLGTSAGSNMVSIRVGTNLAPTLMLLLD
jgi:hypothetical protein